MLKQLREQFLHLEESWRFVFFGCCLILNKVANSEFSWKGLLFIFSNCVYDKIAILRYLEICVLTGVVFLDSVCVVVSKGLPGRFLS